MSGVDELGAGGSKLLSSRGGIENRDWGTTRRLQGDCGVCVIDFN